MAVSSPIIPKAAFKNPFCLGFAGMWSMIGCKHCQCSIQDTIADGPYIITVAQGWVHAEIAVIRCEIFDRNGDMMRGSFTGNRQTLFLRLAYKFNRFTAGYCAEYEEDIQFRDRD